MPVVSIQEVSPPNYYPESAQIDSGVEFGMYLIDSNSRISIPSAVVEMDINSECYPSPEELILIHKIYSKLYTQISTATLQQVLQLHRLAFLHPAYSRKPEDIDLTFGIHQTGRLNGFAINLNPDVPTPDLEALIVLLRNNTTSVPLGIGAGEHSGSFAYENPSFVLDKNGGQIIDLSGIVAPSEARVLIIPGRTAVIDPALEPEAILRTVPQIIHINDLPSIIMKNGETPPIPHLVIARAATILVPASELANKEARIKMAQKLWV